MRINILGTRGLPPTYGGFETLANHLGNGLAESGHSILVYGRKTMTQPKKASLRPNLQTYRSFTLPIEAIESVLAGITSGLHTIFIAKPDIVLFCNPANVWTAKVIQALGTPVVLHMAGLEHTRKKWTGLGSLFLERAIRSAAKSKLTLLTDSHAVADWYSRELNRKLKVIAYGAEKTEVDIEKLPTHLRENDYDLVVARWEADTQVAEIIRAHAASRRTQQLVVVGQSRKPDAYSQAVMQAIASHPNCVNLGPIWDQAFLDTLWAYSSIYIHGHRTGGTNPALLRGAAAGVEVLHHDNPFNNEVTGDFAWKWKTASELTELLKDSPWIDSPKRDRLASTVQTNYQWDNIIRQYENLFKDLIRNQNG